MLGLKLAKRGFIVSGIKHIKGFHTFQKGLQNTKGHFSEILGRFIFVNSFVKVGLGKSSQAKLGVYIYQMGGLHAVADWKGNILQNFTPPGILACRALYDRRERREQK